MWRAAGGALGPPALAAAEALAEDEGVAATVVCVSSPDRLYRDWRRARVAPVTDGRVAAPSHLERLLAPERGVPIVTVIDGASHALAWLGGALGAPTVPLGVDDFGQTGSQRQLYEAHGIAPDAIVTAALAALEPAAR
jgi:pyruvate dehydrogenase E1 component